MVYKFSLPVLLIAGWFLSGFSGFPSTSTPSDECLANIFGQAPGQKCIRTTACTVWGNCKPKSTVINEITVWGCTGTGGKPGTPHQCVDSGQASGGASVGNRNDCT
jgi:hypothetical protein